MKREPAHLANNHFDVLVVGAGIHGACIAREAAIRGLTTALVDRSDFGAGTSANSLKIIHGGLRYLQKLDLRRMRESVRERRTLMRIAPHLVHALPCVVPTHGWGRRSRAALRAALTLTGWIAPDKGDPSDQSHHLPPGRMLSRSELIDLFPGLAERADLTGAALWHDGQAYNTERLTLAFVRDAVERGAIAANYVEAARLLLRGGRVIGAEMHDRIDGERFDIHADLVINAAGPWVDGLLRGTDSNLSRRKPALLCKAWNVVTKRLHPTHALGILAGWGGLCEHGHGRMLFVTPWRDRSIIGTMYAPVDSDRDPHLSDEEVRRLIGGFNAAHPGEQLALEDVTLHHVGLLHVRNRDTLRGVDELEERPGIIDHSREDSVGGIVSVIGVKYTTGRLVAERVLDRACGLLGKQDRTSVDSSCVPVDGGTIDHFDRFQASLLAGAPEGIKPIVARLARNYGTRADELIEDCRATPEHAVRVGGSEDAIRAEVLYGIREEMAVKLSDIVMRRTELGTAAYPGDGPLRACALLMAGQLGWSPGQMEEEIAEVASIFGKRVARQTPTAGSVSAASPKGPAAGRDDARGSGHS